MKKQIDSLKKLRKESASWINFIKEIRPGKGFEKLPVPSAPDYSFPDHWAAHPDKKSKALFVPEGSPPPVGDAAKADVFFIHPTSFFGKTHWNAPLDHPIPREMVDQLIMPGQASVFNQSCRIFAPRYRQATFYVFAWGGANAQKALDFAYQDVETAFDHYLTHHNKGRPFFIASHSQGTIHAIRLLETRIDPSPLRHQMVAAYPIGFQFPMDKFERTLKNLRPSESPTDTGTVIAWDSFQQGGGPIHSLDRTRHWYPGKNDTGKWERRAKKTPLGVNPLSWRRDEKPVERSLNLGAVNIELDGPPYDLMKLYGDTAIGINSVRLSVPYKEEVSARLQDGFLYISRPNQPQLRRFLLPGLNFHNYDYALFYMNMRKNIGERLNAFLTQKS